MPWRDPAHDLVELAVPEVAVELLRHLRRCARLRDPGCTAIVHLAAYKSVGESVEHRGKYWHTNVDGTSTMVEAALRAGVRELVFSSSCSVYGTPELVPVAESAEIRPESVYAESKPTVERVLRWYGVTDGLCSVSLRYFNAAGAGADGKIGEDWTFSIVKRADHDRDSHHPAFDR